MTKPKIDISAGLRPRTRPSAPPARPMSAPTEPNTGRDVLHTPIHAATIQAAATADHPAVKAALKKAIANVQGTTMHGARDAKPAARLRQKIEGERQPPRTVPDYSAFRVAVGSPEAKARAVDAIRGNFEVHREKDEFDHGAPDSGFHAHMLQVRRPGGDVTHEVQVLPKEQADVAEDAHGLYEKARGGDETAGAAMKAKNLQAKAAFDARNGGKAPTAHTGEHKYKFGTVQHDLSPTSDAQKAIMAAQKAIPKHHLANDGTDEDADKPHVTVRYGVQGSKLDGLRDFIKKQSPFTAKLGKTAGFPPSEHSDGAVPIHAPVDSPELHRLHAEIEKHGDFAPSNFPEYKPHVTVAYVKPEHAKQHVGNTATEGKTFHVSHISIGDRDGNKEDVPMLGTKSAFPERKGGRGESPEPAKGGGVQPAPAAELDLPPIAKGSSVALSDGAAGKVQWIMGGKVRIKTLDGSRRDAPLKDATAIPNVSKTEGKFTGVDLDKTLAHYDEFKGATVIGAPIPKMVQRVQKLLGEGKDVRIFTARITAPETRSAAIKAVQEWTEKHIGRKLPVTNIKDSRMELLLDDRATGVVPNTGDLVGHAHDLSAGLRPKDTASR